MTGTDLRDLRLTLGLTQAALAERIGMHPNTIARMERDELAITTRTRITLHLLAIPAARPVEVGA